MKVQTDIDPGMIQAAPTTAPCIVLGLETQIGLAVVRELGRAGIRVVGIAHDARALGLASRYLWRRRVVPEPRSPELLATLRALGDELGPCSLLVISEANLTWLSAHRAELGAVRPALPSAESLALVLDKQETLKAARAVGIDVPFTAEPASMPQALALAESFRFPAVLKWKDPGQVAGRLRTLGLPLVKAEYVNTAADWLAAAKRYEPLGEWPMVQTYVPGRGLGQFFFMHEGRAARRFQHLRIAEWPPEGGFSSVCDAVPLDRHADLQHKSVELLRRIGWQGVAMVEYRWDVDTGKAVLMEVNGRFWGSLPLAVHCHAGFAVLAHFAALGQALPDLPPPLQDMRCRMVATELKRLGRLLFAPRRIADKTFRVQPLHEVLAFLGNFLRPSVSYFVWSLDDPLPYLADLRNLVWKRR